MACSTVNAAFASRGVTLIEVMVTLFIVSIGLLGVAGLQSTSIASGYTATQRSLVNFHAADLAERMRANRDAIISYGGAGADNDCTASCTAAQMAALDVYEWREALRASLGVSVTGTTIVVNNAETPADVTITINWQDRKEDNTQTLTLNLQI